MRRPDEPLHRPPSNTLPRHGMLFDWPQSASRWHVGRHRWAVGSQSKPTAQ